MIHHDIDLLLLNMDIDLSMDTSLDTEFQYLKRQRNRFTDLENIKYTDNIQIRF